MGLDLVVGDERRVVLRDPVTSHFLWARTARATVWPSHAARFSCGAALRGAQAQTRRSRPTPLMDNSAAPPSVACWNSNWHWPRLGISRSSRCGRVSKLCSARRRGGRHETDTRQGPRLGALACRPVRRHSPGDRFGSLVGRPSRRMRSHPTHLLSLNCPASRLSASLFSTSGPRAHCLPRFNARPRGSLRQAVRSCLD